MLLFILGLFSFWIIGFIFYKISNPYSHLSYSDLENLTLIALIKNDKKKLEKINKEIYKRYKKNLLKDLEF